MTCGLYLPGHDVHFIQARLSWNEPKHPPMPGVVTDISDDGEFRVKFEGKRNRRRYWNHDPQRLAHQVARNDGHVELRDYGVLATLTDQGQSLFYVAKPNSQFRRPCPGPGDPGPSDPIDALLTRGGFLMPAATALRAAERRSTQASDST